MIILSHFRLVNKQMWDRDYYKNEKERSKNRRKEEIYEKKKNMKIYDIIHVSALMDDYTRYSTRHKYSNKEGSQGKKPVKR